MRSTRLRQLLPRGIAPSTSPLVRLGLMATVAMVFFLSACGAVGDACLFDSDCSGGNLCVRDMCRAACSVEADCEPPENRCLAVTRERLAEKETVKVCVDERFDADVDGGNVDCKASGDCCTSDADCIELYDDSRARCGRDARCLIPLS